MKALCALVLLFVSFTSQAQVATGKGKIIYVQGHTAPTCRTVLHREVSSGIDRHFRIPAAGQDNISSVLLSALIANRDVEISYNPSVTSGCGTEPAINHITIY